MLLCEIVEVRRVRSFALKVKALSDALFKLHSGRVAIDDPQ